ncbi:MAG: ABC transporter permease [Candidatus Aenigmarchaeota archaeon]|nr:ABC transporter permease [Candidatus Aenigmarchaeota archaeon]
MRLYKIRSIMLRDMMILKKSKIRFIESFYFPITTVLIWGLFSLYSKAFSLEAGMLVLAVNILWSFAYLAQSVTNILIMEDVWSDSFKQVILTGVSQFEYLTARILVSILNSVAVLAIMLGMAYYIFGMTIIAENFAGILMLSAVTITGSIGLAVIISAMIIGLGREYAFLSWSAMQLFVFFSLPFIPLAAAPQVLQYISQIMPYTAVFEGARAIVTTGSVPPPALYKGFAIAAAYIIVSLPFYRHIFERARRNGNLVRLA